jgi:hypothetical protein
VQAAVATSRGETDPAQMHSCPSVRAAAAALLLALPAAAAEPTPPDPAADAWEFEAFFYGWGIALNGDVSAGPVSADVDVSFSEILDDLNLGAMGALEAQRGRLLFLVDGVWAELEDDVHTGVRTRTLSRLPGDVVVTAGPVEVDAKLDQVLLDAKAGWRVFSRPVSELWGAASGASASDDPRRFVVDLLAGFRYWYLKSEIGVDLPAATVTVNGVPVDPGTLPDIDLGPIELPGELLRGAHRSFDESWDWVDPILGLRTRIDLTDRLFVGLLGDGGGFGIGSASHSTWQAAGVVGWKLSERWSLRAGYKAVAFDRDEIDLTFHGPVMAVGYRF